MVNLGWDCDCLVVGFCVIGCWGRVLVGFVGLHVLWVLAGLVSGFRFGLGRVFGCGELVWCLVLLGLVGNSVGWLLTGFGFIGCNRVCLGVWLFEVVGLGIGFVGWVVGGGFWVVG